MMAECGHDHAEVAALSVVSGRKVAMALTARRYRGRLRAIG
jgi:hypothetical protein